jgi:hypothetical protein
MNCKDENVEMIGYEDERLRYVNTYETIFILLCDMFNELIII